MNVYCFPELQGLQAQQKQRPPRTRQILCKLPSHLHPRGDAADGERSASWQQAARRRARRYLGRGAVLGQVSGAAAVAAGDGLVGAVVPRAVPRAPAVRDLRLRREKTFSTGPALRVPHSSTRLKAAGSVPTEIQLFTRAAYRPGLNWVVLSQGDLHCLEEKYRLVQTPTAGLHFFCCLNS